MDGIYKDWIAKYLENNNPYGDCKQAVEQMQNNFPELSITAGHVFTNWGKRSHFWLITQSGEIIDPTASQFPIIFEYEAFEPGDEVRVGKCMNCGDEIWRPLKSLQEKPERITFCSKKCEKIFCDETFGLE